MDFSSSTLGSGSVAASVAQYLPTYRLGRDTLGKFRSAAVGKLDSCQTTIIFAGLDDTYLRRTMAQTFRGGEARLQRMAPHLCCLNPDERKSPARDYEPLVEIIQSSKDFSIPRLGFQKVNPR